MIAQKHIRNIHIILFYFSESRVVNKIKQMLKEALISHLFHFMLYVQMALENSQLMELQ